VSFAVKFYFDAEFVVISPNRVRRDDFNRNAGFAFRITVQSQSAAETFLRFMADGLHVSGGGVGFAEFVGWVFA
jgi:hypothetical protein